MKRKSLSRAEKAKKTKQLKELFSISSKVKLTKYQTKFLWSRLTPKEMKRKTLPKDYASRFADLSEKEEAMKERIQIKQYQVEHPERPPLYPDDEDYVEFYSDDVGGYLDEKVLFLQEIVSILKSANNANVANYLLDYLSMLITDVGLIHFDSVDETYIEQAEIIAFDSNTDTIARSAIALLEFITDGNVSFADSQYIYELAEEDRGYTRSYRKAWRNKK